MLDKRAKKTMLHKLINVIVKKYLFAWMLVVSAVAIQSCNTEKAQENDVAKSEGKSDSIAMDHGKMDGMHDMHETRLTGDIDFDFATLMMEHHQGAVDMAKSVLAKGANAEVRVIAQNIVTAQEADRKSVV